MLLISLKVVCFPYQLHSKSCKAIQHHQTKTNVVWQPMPAIHLHCMFSCECLKKTFQKTWGWVNVDIKCSYNRTSDRKGLSESNAGRPCVIKRSGGKHWRRGRGGGPSSHPDSGFPFQDQLGWAPGLLYLTRHTRTHIPVAYISNGSAFVWVFVFLAWRQKEALADGLVQTS